MPVGSRVSPPREFRWLAGALAADDDVAACVRRGEVDDEGADLSGPGGRRAAELGAFSLVAGEVLLGGVDCEAVEVGFDGFSRGWSCGGGGGSEGWEEGLRG